LILLKNPLFLETRRSEAKMSGKTPLQIVVRAVFFEPLESFGGVF
jgi:hypothetical protein